MNNNLMPFPAPGRILLLVAPDSSAGTLFEMVARLALQDSIYVIDGGNTFQGYPLAQSLHRQGADIARVMARVLLSRAFTCYQMAALCSEEPFAPHPILVLDFLATFYDQGVRIAERRRLLAGCLRRLNVLSRHTPVALWVCQRAVIPEEGLGFLETVQRAAGQVWRPERPALTLPRQLPLLPGL